MIKVIRVFYEVLEELFFNNLGAALIVLNDFTEGNFSKVFQYTSAKIAFEFQSHALMLLREHLAQFSQGSSQHSLLLCSPRYQPLFNEESTSLPRLLGLKESGQFKISLITSSYFDVETKLNKSRRYF